MTSVAVLNFTEDGMLGCSKPLMVNIYKPTKFDANIFIGDRDDIAKNQIQDGGGISSEGNCWPPIALVGPM